MLFRRYVIDLALHNLSLSGLLLLSKSVSSQMLFVMFYCRCLVINVRGAAVDVSSAPVAFAATAAGAGEVPSLLGSMLMSSLVEMLNLLVVAGAASSTAVAGLAKLQP